MIVPLLLDLPPTDPLQAALAYHSHVAETVEQADAAAAERAEAAATASRTADRSSPTNVTLACIRDHESGGDYTVVNSLGYAGAYQLSPTYADDWARRYGYGQWADVPVPQWPPAVQDGVALALGLDSNWTPWSQYGGYWCEGF